jgi:uncharacterized protein YcnI
MKLKLFLLTSMALAPALPAAAHVVISPGSAPAGSYYAGWFRVSHGCGGSPTTALRIEIPPGVISAKPQPKPGWTLRIDRVPLAQPVAGEGGQTIRERVAAITWTGRLPDDEFDEFGVMMKLPPGAGALAFPAVQTCETGENRWTDLAAPGQSPHALPHPAPILTLTPAMPMGEMHHP